MLSERFFVFLLLGSVYFGLNFYISSRLLKWLGAVIKLNRTAFNTVYWVLASVLVLYFVFVTVSSRGGVSLPLTVKQAVYTVNSVWMGVFVYFVWQMY